MPRKTLLVALTTGVLLLLVNGAVAAQSLGEPAAITPSPGVPSSPDDSVSMPTLDTDKDGSISRMEAEANRRLTKQFANLDKNANGALEPAEFARFEAENATGTPGTSAGLPPPTPGREQDDGAGNRGQ